jgi:hypothetical protein
VTTDGPFVEAREHHGGFHIIEVDDVDAALVWAAKATAILYVPIEVRPLADPERDGIAHRRSRRQPDSPRGARPVGSGRSRTFGNTDLVEDRCGKPSPALCAQGRAAGSP